MSQDVIDLRSQLVTNKPAGAALPSDNQGGSSLSAVKNAEQPPKPRSKKGTASVDSTKKPRRSPRETKCLKNNNSTPKCAKSLATGKNASTKPNGNLVQTKLQFVTSKPTGRDSTASEADSNTDSAIANVDGNDSVTTIGDQSDDDDDDDDDDDKDCNSGQSKALCVDTISVVNTMSVDLTDMRRLARLKNAARQEMKRRQLSLMVDHRAVDKSDLQTIMKDLSEWQRSNNYTPALKTNDYVTIFGFASSGKLQQFQSALAQHGEKIGKLVRPPLRCKVTKVPRDINEKTLVATMVDAYSLKACDINRAKSSKPIGYSQNKEVLFEVSSLAYEQIFVHGINEFPFEDKSYTIYVSFTPPYCKNCGSLANHRGLECPSRCGLCLDKSHKPSQCPHKFRPNLWRCASCGNRTGHHSRSRNCPVRNKKLITYLVQSDLPELVLSSSAHLQDLLNNVYKTANK